MSVSGDFSATSTSNRDGVSSAGLISFWYFGILPLRAS